MITGGCLCKAVRYKSTEMPVTVRACWCRVCQYIGAGGPAVGAAFKTATFTVEGSPKDYVRIADSGNRMHTKFCPECGTPLFCEADSRPHLVFVRVGSLDDPNIVRPAMSIWTASAPDWACIDKDIPQVPGQPPPAA